MAKSREKEEIGEPNPVADLVLETLQQAPALRYKGWNRVKDTLSHIPPSKRTTELVGLLCSALQGEMVYWQRLQKIEQSISLASLRSLSTTAAIFPVMVLTGLEVKPDETGTNVTTGFPEIEEDYLALDDILVQLQRLEKFDPDDQATRWQCRDSGKF